MTTSPLLRILPLALLALLLWNTTLFAQPGSGAMVPGRSLQRESKPMSSADSIKFETAFKEIYPLLRADPDVKQIAQRYLKKLLRNATAHGLDSLKLYDSIMTHIDTNMDAEMLRDAMKGTMTGDDIRALKDFLQTPAGKRYMEVEWAVVRTRTELVDRAVARYLTFIIGPLSNRPEPPKSIRTETGPADGGPSSHSPQRGSNPVQH